MRIPARNLEDTNVNLKSTIDRTIATFDSVVSKIEAWVYDMSAIKKCTELCENCDICYFCNPNYPEF